MRRASLARPVDEALAINISMGPVHFFIVRQDQMYAFVTLKHQFQMVLPIKPSTLTNTTWGLQVA